MKILIVGASSFIGFRLFTFLKENSKYEIFGTYFKNKVDSSFLKLDIQSKEDIKKTIDFIKPNIIIWIASNKNLKFCQEDLEEAKKINTNPIYDVVDILSQSSVKPYFMYLSTDCVFDGNSGNYGVMDIPNPQTHYGVSKYLAEKIVQEKYNNFVIIRTSAVMGKGGTFFDWIISELKKETTIELFENSFFTPTPITLLVESILNLIYKNKNGIFHICGTNKFSRYEFGNYLKSLSNDFVANLTPFSLNETDTLFQKDLSILPSDFLNTEYELFKAYLKKEI